MAELRKDPILGEWVIIAPERSTRPFDQVLPDTTLPSCPFCKGNESWTPDAVLTIPTDDSPDAWAVRVVPNRYPAVGSSTVTETPSEFFQSSAATGHHEVIIESPTHQRSMRELSGNQFFHIMRAWRDRLLAVSSDKTVAHTMIFKNEGASAGASLEHIHSQLLATSFIPPTIDAELTAGQKYFEQTGNNLWAKTLSQEQADGSRIVSRNGDFTLLCPFASQFAGLMQILPQKTAPAFEATSDGDLQTLANLLKSAVECLHEVFPHAPFNLGLHSAPPRDSRRDSFCWRLTITPRLTGIAGFEISSGSMINIISPEDAASRYHSAFQPKSSHGQS